jgi:hypothetical protein
MATITLTPNGDGALTQNTVVGGVAAYQALQANDGTTEFIHSAGAGMWTNLVTFANPGIPSGSTVASVTVYALCEYSGSAPGTVYLDVYVGGTKYTSSANSPVASSWTQYSNTWTVNPYTGVAWTPADVNTGLQIGSDLVGTAKLSTYCTQLWATVTYTPPSGSPITCIQMIRLY